MPQFLTTCPCCGSINVSWSHEGRQLFPAKYAQLTSFKKHLDSGNYQWQPDRENFGVELYTCSACGSTRADIRENHVNSN